MTGRESIVIVGAGKGAAQLVASLRDEGSSAEIVVIGEEPLAPYERPPLSKEYLVGDLGPDGLSSHPDSFYDEHDVELRVGATVAAIDPPQRTVVLRDGERIGYDRLVLATGAVPRPLPIPGAECDGVLGLRSVADADQLHALLEARQDLVVIGGGYLGLEVAAAAATHFGATVTVIEALPRLLARTALPETAQRALDYHQSLGVRFRLETQVLRIGAGDDGSVAFVETDRGERIPAGVVFYGIGVIPRDELAVAAGLATGNGIRVDASLRTSAEGIWAIGDCCEFPSAHIDASVRLESIQNVVDQARHLAAEFAGGAREDYRATPWFWSDQAALKVQSVGYVRDHDERVVVPGPEEGRFSVLAFRDGRFVGADSVNIPGHHLALRRLYSSGATAALTVEATRSPGFELQPFVKSVLAGQASSA